MEPADVALAYHERTKHHLHRFARSLGYLDWATMPEPFRTWDGAPVLPLPLAADRLPATYDQTLRPGALPPAPPALETLATLLELSLGLSAWKQAGWNRWALRCNPSSGNLHPTEGYLLVPGFPGLPPGLWHYVSRDHALERRAAPGDDGASRLSSALGGAFLVGLSSIPWREAWKYGERAYRYCQHDAGHALAAVRLAAAALGWRVRLLDLPEADVAALLGLDRDEDATGIDPLDRERPDFLLLAGPSEAVAPEPALDASLLSGARWSGRPNALSPEHLRWEVLDEVAEACSRRGGAAGPPVPRPPGDRGLPPPGPRPFEPFSSLARRRRSAVGFDGATPYPLAAFAATLDLLLSRPGVPPWDALPWEPLVHPVLLVHRVEGIEPGLYALPRSPEGEALLRAGLSRSFEWRPVGSVPAHLPLRLLVPGDFRERARTVSCHQPIASDGAFAVAMLAPLPAVVRERGARWYPRLFHEAGALGQVLYLEAEAWGLRGTGIGCFFDDAVHDLLGVADGALQSLYHFTAGAPLDDPRVSTSPPYAHLTGRL